MRQATLDGATWEDVRERLGSVFSLVDEGAVQAWQTLDTERARGHAYGITSALRSCLIWQHRQTFMRQMVENEGRWQDWQGPRDVEHWLHEAEQCVLARASRDGDIGGIAAMAWFVERLGTLWGFQVEPQAIVLRRKPNGSDSQSTEYVAIVVPFPTAVTALHHLEAASLPRPAATLPGT